ncbi:uncharacterized protein GGS22DRAFT_184605 [Annulohypoxylon maeteangense]|uniref:uncharacterized protein n=1 Tax=Annulohypoxylon maeteangense TaxID=1927788 RepID=UPI0020084F54|nr:uncharacterized protein GGS22DRAFT_184605 [Annulohypoxylon maeteangense]KAI0889030.1 hypothetical protein GGS22DRAFT_184605 [Annulohypoxylon maeteangense]
MNHGTKTPKCEPSSSEPASPEASTHGCSTQQQPPFSYPTIYGPIEDDLTAAMRGLYGPYNADPQTVYPGEQPDPPGPFGIPYNLSARQAFSPETPTERGRGRYQVPLAARTRDPARAFTGRCTARRIVLDENLTSNRTNANTMDPSLAPRTPEPDVPLGQENIPPSTPECTPFAEFYVAPAPGPQVLPTSWGVDPHYPAASSVYSASDQRWRGDSSDEWGGTTLVGSNWSFERNQGSETLDLGEGARGSRAPPWAYCGPVRTGQEDASSDGTVDHDEKDDGEDRGAGAYGFPEQGQDYGPLYPELNPEPMDEEHHGLPGDEETVVGDSGSEPSQGKADGDEEDNGDGGGGDVRHVEVDGNVYIDLETGVPLSRFEECIRALPTMHIRGNLYIRTKRKQAGSVSGEKGSEDQDDQDGYYGDSENSEVWEERPPKHR